MSTEEIDHIVDELDLDLTERPAQEAPQRKQQKRSRKDPRPRPAFADINQVRSGDRDRKYVLCYRPTVERYLEIGWEIEVSRFGGPKLSGRTVKEGEPLEYSGHVLMSMSREDFEDLQQYGHKDGGAIAGLGQEHADRIEKEIISQTSARRDALRGIGGGDRYFRIQNETTPETVEVRG
jgi:hypothetical protein